MEEKKWSTGAWKKQTQKGEVINFTINDVKNRAMVIKILMTF
jgi:hypothetical protein